MNKLFIISMIAFLGLFLLLSKSFAQNAEDINTVVTEDMTIQANDSNLGLGAYNDDEDDEGDDEEEDYGDDDE